ncbi:hypothetical protein JTE90_018722 [Oedothorax gibbosus]|uniref:Uncharacterized protein n=1 Tax=Oedothorax gibbosus TaxID=931172 RepID=A0AAV6UL02_9ARAC|nr:hypothetical protein JTE90_018722 [Oedothorax gibbosus]
MCPVEKREMGQSPHSRVIKEGDFRRQLIRRGLPLNRMRRKCCGAVDRGTPNMGWRHFCASVEKSVWLQRPTQFSLRLELV